MKYSAFAIIAVAAMMCAPVAADAAVKKNHKLHHVAYSHSVRHAYGMYDPAGAQEQPVAPPSFSRGGDANSMSGYNSANENAEGRSGG